MANSNLIKDNTTRESIQELERTKKRLEQIPQLSRLPLNASVTEVEYNKLVDTINKITNSIKRR